MAQYILNNSLKRSNEVQKFVLDTCKGVPGHRDFTNEFTANTAVFEAETERRTALGWFLREAGPRWTSIQLLACALEYCSLFEGQQTRQTEIDTN